MPSGLTEPDGIFPFPEMEKIRKWIHFRIWLTFGRTKFAVERKVKVIRIR